MGSPVKRVKQAIRVRSMKSDVVLSSVKGFFQLQELYNSSDENRSLVDSELITAAVFGETADSPRLPQNGEVNRIANSRKRLVYDGNKCQLVARAADITT
ncbi:hypothetical protein P43SY_006437 [Pythium insidiosum]|uniref:Uncharacterized protein n=1 Tax=Pythium insidiosum TaxID=114742 RepID=A0AAD5LPD0_PYTIN|nr:hypothetical protein P43SY_006437 [Pythium insidiosum]